MCRQDVDARDIGERSDAVLRTDMRRHVDPVFVTALAQAHPRWQLCPAIPKNGTRPRKPLRSAESLDQPWVGQAVPRKEDQALLSGGARFIDDLAPVPGLKHAAILRSPHPHARIRAIDATRALALPGVVGVVTGAQLLRAVGPIPSVVRAPVPYYPFATDKARYVGEPVAVVVADTRYIAEDACELIAVDYEPLPAAANLAAAQAAGAPLLHDKAGSNTISTRSFRYGDPERAFGEADHVVDFAYSYPRYASTPMETFGVVAQFEPAPDRFTVWSNFQGPFVLQPLMAGALKVAGNRLRLITPPHSGGSFGIKQAVRNIAVVNDLVVTNQTPIGLNRGYGGPQFYFALERLMDIAARRLKMDPATLRRRNFVPKEAFPYACPAGSILDAGDYGAALDELMRLADYEALLRRRDAARSEGRLYGIGFCAGIEPSGSNMAYVGLAQTPEERAKTDPKSGAHASAVVSIDPSGSVTVRLSSTPNGQGHATVAAQIVADKLGLKPDDIDVVTEIDTLTSNWSIASGNYSNRFAAVVVGAIAETADKVAHTIRLIAAEALDVPPDKIELTDGYAKVADGSNRGMPLRRIAARAHWNPNGLPAGVSPGIYESTTLSPPSLASPDAQDRIPSAVTYGFVVDLVAVEIERATGVIRIDKYVSVHDVGRQLNPRIVEGQVHGGLAHGLGAALMEELAYDAGGNFLSGTFADYLCPTAMEMPPVTIGHVETRSPMNVLGAKGMGDGSSMLTPAAIANAVADALGRDDITLPLTLQRVWALANDVQPARRPAKSAQAARLAGGLRGEGAVTMAAPPSEVWRRLIDPVELARIVPGCKSLEQVGPDRYHAEVMIGVAGIRGLYAAQIALKDKREPKSVRLVGT